jgi:hypothetical protein
MNKKQKSEQERERLHRAWPHLSQGKKHLLLARALWGYVLSQYRNLRVRHLLIPALVGQIIVMLITFNVEPDNRLIIWGAGNMVVAGLALLPTLKRPKRFHWVR